LGPDHIATTRRAATAVVKGESECDLRYDDERPMEQPCDA
jgi:hypothetical protein